MFSDIPTPVKRHIGGSLADIETRLYEQIVCLFTPLNLAGGDECLVKWADMAALVLEVKYLRIPPELVFKDGLPIDTTGLPTSDDIQKRWRLLRPTGQRPMITHFEQSRAMFMARYIHIIDESGEHPMDDRRPTTGAHAQLNLTLP